jgi:transcription initiation factor TFIID TATA-box-binding protein
LEIEKVRTSVKVVNIVASVTLKQRVNLNSIIRRFPSAKFPSEQFPGVVFRMRRPRVAALIFSSGKIICVGGKSEREVYDAVDNLIMRLVKGGIITLKKSELRINNIVATANFGRTIDLSSISTWPGAIYEPEQFPALIYYMEYPKLVFLIFSSGRIICLGAKNESEIRKAINELLIRLVRAGAFKDLTLEIYQAQTTIGSGKSSFAQMFKLRDFAISDSEGRSCVHVDGLWCWNRFCDGPPCKFAHMILGKVINGVYGYWGFHWYEKWYTNQTKKALRKFFD